MNIIMLLHMRWKSVAYRGWPWDFLAFTCIHTRVISGRPPAWAFPVFQDCTRVFLGFHDRIQHSNNAGFLPWLNIRMVHDCPPQQPSPLGTPPSHSLCSIANMAACIRVHKHGTCFTLVPAKFSLTHIIGQIVMTSFIDIGSGSVINNH